jgi:hypothetical protein
LDNKASSEHDGRAERLDESIEAKMKLKDKKKTFDIIQHEH